MTLEQNNKLRINSSLDWTAIDIELTRKTSKLEYGADVRKMIRNIQIQVTELSKVDVNMRSKVSNNAQELKEQINKDIELVEEYLVVAALIGQKW